MDGFTVARPLIAVWALTLLILGATATWLQLDYRSSPAPEGDARADIGAGAAEPVAVPTAPPVSGEDAEAATPPVDAEAAIGPAPVPDPALLESGPHGPLPVRGEDGREPWKVYSRPYHGPADAPKIAIILQEIGIGEAATQAAIEDMPGDVTLALSPYAPTLQDTARRAREAGHELLLMVPMEPVAYPANDPGPHTLRVGRPPEETLDRLHFVMSRVQGYVGLVNHMGSRFSADRDSLAAIMRDLSRRGVAFLDARASARSLIPETAAAHGVPVVSNNRFLDNIAAADEIDRLLAELVHIAERDGMAVGIGRPYPVTLDRIRRWAEGLEPRGVALAPVSALIAQATG